jgi:hypothetical protein
VSCRLAICFETVVKSNCALRDMPVEGEDEEDLRRYSLECEFGCVLEPELKLPASQHSRYAEVRQGSIPLNLAYLPTTNRPGSVG